LKFRDERKATLRDLIPHEGGQARYTYGFGDDWEHDVVVEKLLVAEPGMRDPVCVAAAGACPPEDCGGVWGVCVPPRDPRRPRRRGARRHPGVVGAGKAGDFDPYGFDVDTAKRALTAVGALR
jgi:Plasmid pRiA4b ORF-3-like protein